MTIDTEQDLLRLIAVGEQESLTLEYKRCAALDNTDAYKNEISKDVSAFANAAGGTLIYGIIDDKHVPTDLDVGFSPGEGRRDWLDQVIDSRIQPRIQGVLVREIPLTGDKAGRVVYVVDVPQSHTAHQAHDKRYYKRRNFQVSPMDDYEVRDVMNRAKAPLVIPELEFRRNDRAGGDAGFFLHTYLHNQGDVTAHYIRIEFALPLQLIDNNVVLYQQRKRRNTFDRRSYEELVCIAEIEDRALFPDQRIVLGEWGYGGPMIKMSRQHFLLMDNIRAELNWIVYADDMRRQEGRMSLSDLINY
jgi:Putative DNA-binding domain